ncbi:BTAD domain-containing putative transcriptional regulator [Streptomyces sp. NPDC041068]|uniref:AfsR/SARP family transcriptional regulator n=1 Tax=Streptomyces sp. NPDC041068 TaxID=3155130 RepID=UPI0033DCB16A
MVDLLALGPLELWQRDRQCPLGSVKERCVLAVLIHARGEPVTVDTLIDRVWDTDPPPTAQSTLHAYLSRVRGRLRRSVGELARVERPSPRLYQLRVADPGDVDLLRFRRLRTEAAAAAEGGKQDLAIGLLHTAEALWRGEPLAEFTSSWAASARARLIEDHRRVREERIRLELELGRHADLLGELHELAAQNPLAQQIVASLMLALYRSGRHDEALALYRTTRERLHESLGIEPGATLQELHVRILNQDHALLPPPRPLADHRSAPPQGRPGQDAALPRDNLPRDSGDFTGRTAELRILLGGLRPSAHPDGEPDPAHPEPRHTAHALPLTVISGMPGVGKTALAVHAAHRLRAAYPDGQFFVDLRAYSGRPPYDPAEALAVLLHAAGTRDALPDSLDERAARWREWTARHRVLVVLDNARDAAQVAPLLPGAAGCRAIVTSRNRLTGLDGVTPLFLDVLPASEAAALFSRIAGTARLSGAGDAATVRRIVDAGGRHPLAVQLIASGFRHRDSWSPDHLLDRLTEAADPLLGVSELAELDDTVTSAFWLSYTELTPAARRLLRLLSLHPGPDCTLHGAAALAEEPAEAAGPADRARAGAGLRRAVAELLDCHLLEEPVSDRYRLHDLTRAFALRMCAREEPERARREALHRLLGHYLTAAHRAAPHTDPYRRALPLTAGTTSPYAPEFADADEASVWLAVERANLLAAARAAVETSPDHAAYFPHVLAKSLKLWGAWEAAAELYAAAVAVLRGRDDRAALARTLVERADALAQRSHPEALRCATEALSLFAERADRHGRADALLQAARAHFAAGHGATSLRLLDEALGLYRDVGDAHGEAESLNVQGVALHSAGRRREAMERFRAALRLHRATRDMYGQLRALNNLGEAHRLDGRLAEARAHYEQSLELAHHVGGRQERANLLNNLGTLCQAAGQLPEALGYFHRALSSYRGAGDARGESDTLINLGTAYLEGRRAQEALWHFTLAERAAGSVGSPSDRQSALIGIGTANRLLARYEAALDAHHEALRLAREADIPLGSAEALEGLARTTLHTQGASAAGKLATDALTIYEQLGLAERAQGLRERLTGPAATAAGS